MLPNVNKELVPMKAHYFLFNAATGPIVPFLPTIAKQLGFSPTLVGMIYTVLPISGLIAKPLFGGLADKFKLHKTFFLIFQAVVAVALFSINFIPKVDRHANATLTCNGLAYLEVCSKDGFSDKVMHGVITETLHTDISCDLSCKGSNETYAQLCSGWKVSKYCDSGRNDTSSNDDTFNFTIGFNVYRDLPVDKCIDIHIVTATFSDGNVHRPSCNAQLRTSCVVTCHNNVAFNQLLEEAESYEKSSAHSSSYQFQSFLWAAVTSWIGMAVVVSIADAICFDLLGTDGSKEYGKQRMWGSIGFGIFGISAGYLVDIFSARQPQKDYTCIFYIMLVAMILDIVVSATLRKRNPETSSADEPSMMGELFKVCKEGNVLVFGWWCIGAGMCTGVVWNFLFWYIEDMVPATETDWVKTLQGLLTGVQCFLGELPFNFLSGNVLRKLGHVNVMSLVLLIYAIRFMAYSVVSNPWWFLVIEVLHGPSLGLCWPTMVSYGNKVTPPGTKATMQGSIGAVFEGIGVSSGSLICGWLIDTYGGVATLRVFSVGALLWLTFFWLMQLLLRRMKTFPIHRGHNHLPSYANPDDAILMTMSQELQTY